LDVLTALLDDRPLAPSADGALSLRVRCYSDPARGSWTHHPLHLRPDWTVEVPHDLDSERVLTALGGHCSCVELVDRTLPAARERLFRLLRRTVPELSRGPGGQWRCRPADGCCTGAETYRCPEEAADHWRAPRHVATGFGAAPASVKAISRQLLRAHGLHEPVAPPHDLRSATAHCLLEPRGATELWRA
jgi:hypothetical protein